MSPDLDHSSRPAGPTLANDYDSFAEAYAIETESNLVNGYSRSWTCPETWPDGGSSTWAAEPAPCSRHYAIAAPS
ncbi:hypothetical protein ACPFP2_05520 [Micromonospora citrea]|uniref:hypothetical protein n=1 Tax=Micromonospora citrea TaxID=47855 RepID=UPI003C39961C